jgi:DNA-directed RNA polymerase subunit RPC12/RpoP
MERKCNNCGKSLEGRKANAVFCSDLCRVTHYRAARGLPDPFNPAKNIPKSKVKLHSYFHWYPLSCCNNPEYMHPNNNQLLNIRCMNCGAIWEVFITKSSR